MANERPSKCQRRLMLESLVSLWWADIPTGNPECVEHEVTQQLSNLGGGQNSSALGEVGDTAPRPH